MPFDTSEACTGTDTTVTSVTAVVSRSTSSNPPGFPVLVLILYSVLVVLLLLLLFLLRSSAQEQCHNNRHVLKSPGAGAALTTTWEPNHHHHPILPRIILLAFLRCVFSNLSSSCLPERMQSHTGCTFLHCVFSNESSNPPGGHTGALTTAWEANHYQHHQFHSPSLIFSKFAAVQFFNFPRPNYIFAPVSAYFILFF